MKWVFGIFTSVIFPGVFLLCTDLWLDLRTSCLKINHVLGRVKPILFPWSSSNIYHRCKWGNLYHLSHGNFYIRSVPLPVTTKPPNSGPNLMLLRIAIMTLECGHFEESSAEEVSKTEYIKGCAHLYRLFAVELQWSHVVQLWCSHKKSSPWSWGLLYGDAIGNGRWEW